MGYAGIETHIGSRDLAVASVTSPHFGEAKGGSMVFSHSSLRRRRLGINIYLINRCFRFQSGCRQYLGQRVRTIVGSFELKHDR